MTAVRNILAQFPVAQRNDAGTVNVTTGGTTTAIPVGTLTTVAPAFANQHDFIHQRRSYGRQTPGQHALSL